MALVRIRRIERLDRRTRNAIRERGRAPWRRTLHQHGRPCPIRSALRPQGGVERQAAIVAGVDRQGRTAIPTQSGIRLYVVDPQRQHEMAQCARPCVLCFRIRRKSHRNRREERSCGGIKMDRRSLTARLHVESVRGYQPKAMITSTPITRGMVCS